MQLFYSPLGRLRLISYVEGFSLLVLVFIAVPLKYGLNLPQLSSVMGTLHGGFFLLFLLGTLKVSIEENWQFKIMVWKLLLACLIPFGTFYIDLKILKPIYLSRYPKKQPS